MNRVICFVDDDVAELERFTKALTPHNFTCITGQTYTECLQNLRTHNFKPDLWILDLYFPSGRPSTEGEKLVMGERYAQLEEKIREFRAYLATIGQTTEAGMELLKRCLSARRRVPVVMFTRKGMLDDAIRCYETGATAVLKKPMPDKMSGTEAEKRTLLDNALSDEAKILADKFEKFIKENSFWNKHRATTSFFLGVLVTALLESTIVHFLRF